MIEIRFHGRGGQGAVVASELLAQAAFLDGKLPQSFPFFGVERRGAPVTAFTRIDTHPIGVRTSITTPDVVVVLDPGLLSQTRVTEGLKPNGLLLVNTPKPVENLEAPEGMRRAAVDATRIALDHGLGTPMLPIVNTAILGALARATGVVSLAAVNRAIGKFVPGRPEENRLAATDGFANCTDVRPRPSPRSDGGRRPARRRPLPGRPDRVRLERVDPHVRLADLHARDPSRTLHKVQFLLEVLPRRCDRF